jgi:deoxyribose-phosphate aldolase
VLRKIIPSSLNVSFNDLAKMIDHSLLQPSMTDAEVLEGVNISLKYGVATGGYLIVKFQY